MFVAVTAKTKISLQLSGYEDAKKAGSLLEPLVAVLCEKLNVRAKIPCTVYRIDSQYPPKKSPSGLTRRPDLSFVLLAYCIFFKADKNCL
ncbi:MAG: hypothetical protein COA36_16495 [Desulfotalea sp.]|nr:MAG: hypothetical protein COA36_16495 [Desulfotalea sp.]